MIITCVLVVVGGASVVDNNVVSNSVTKPFNPKDSFKPGGNVPTCKS